MNKLLKTIICFFLIIILSLSVIACNSNRDFDDVSNYVHFDPLSKMFDTTLPEGTIEFTHLPINLEQVERIIPLGRINPPGHSYPTSHIYFVLEEKSCPVFAPTFGKIIDIREAGSCDDWKLVVSVTSTMTYFFDHIFIKSELKIGDYINAGDEIAVTGNADCLDFGVYNKNANNAFINSSISSYSDKPLIYYNETMRNLLYSFVVPFKGAAAYGYNEGVTDGEFMLDKAGTLSGNWILTGSEGPHIGQDTLGFGYDVYYPQQIRIGYGKYNFAFALKNEDNPIRPEDATINDGRIAYYIYDTKPSLEGEPIGERFGLMMIQFLSESSIKVEVFEDETSPYREFTSAAQYYTR